MSNPKTVVILGGSYAGVLAAHTLLKKHKTCKVVLVSKVSLRCERKGLVGSGKDDIS